MTKLSNKLKKPCFWPILVPLCQFWGQKKFSWKIWPCHTQLHMGIQHQAKIQKKLMTQFQENARTEGRMEGWKDGWTDGRTERLFYRTLPATTRGPINGMIPLIFTTNFLIFRSQKLARPSPSHCSINFFLNIQTLKRKKHFIVIRKSCIQE